MKRVLIGMSGGVDSSVAAYLLKEAGYEVVGLTFEMFTSNKDDGCSAKTAVIDAKKVCDNLGIEHHVSDFKSYFKSHVIDNFIESYLNAKTPNPCVECNKKLKFGYMYEYAKENNYKTVISERYFKGCMQKRNRYMVDKSDLVLAIWNGSETGGTWNTIKYARSKNKEILYIMLDEI